MKHARSRRPAPASPLAVAADLDGTLTLEGRRLADELTRTILEIKRGGAKFILATGRCTREAREIAGRDLFDAIVAENGAVLAVGGDERSMAPPGWMKIRERLLPHLGTGCEEVIVSAGIERLAIARRLVPRQGTIELNKDRLMVLPRGVTKGRGLLAALSVLGLPPSRTACVGDGENDISMFESVGIKVALDNSVDELKRRADFVALKGDGEGTIEAMGRLFPALVRGRTEGS